MSAMLTADWFLLGRDLYYRKFDVYSMGWQQEVSMENVVSAVAPYGGPIALMRDKTKPVKVQGSVQSIIPIFSPSGKKLAAVKSGGIPIIKIGWSNQEELITIQDNSSVSLYTMYGDFIRTFDISQEAKDTKIIDALIFTNSSNLTGIAILSTTFKVFFVNNIYDPKMRVMSELPRSPIRPVWAVIPKERDMEVLAARGREIYRLTEDRNVTAMLEVDITHQHHQILAISVSFNTKHVAFFTDAGYLWLGSVDLTKKYCEVNTDIITTLHQLVWCGNEAVVAFWGSNDKTLMIVGKYGEKITYCYDGSVHLMPEIDGVRVISSCQHELIQKVPDVVQKIFRINSTEPGSFLLEASKQFQKRSHRADEYISLVRNNLLEAVEQCIEAAGYEFDSQVQKMLIRAAQFGKCFVANIDPDHYVKMCRVLRVLNAVRDRKIGIPLTYTELLYQGHKSLLDRLVKRHHYYLAIEIAKYLKMPEKDGSSRILVHWAKYKVRKQGIDDEILSRQIAEKLNLAAGVSFSEIANAADSAGRKNLAIKLLEYETKSSEQVGLLLKLEEYKQALLKALESGDTDLTYKVILKSHNKLSSLEFKGIIQEFPVALSLYVKYCREHNSIGLRDILKLSDDHNALGQLSVIESIDDKKKLDQNSLLWSAIESYKAARNDLCANLCEDQSKLIKKQKSYEEKYHKDFNGKSIHDTCKLLLDMNELKEAEKFKNEYKIPDKRFWWLKIQSLADNECWDDLDLLARSKKSPIGYAPFVDVSLEKMGSSRNTDQIKRLVNGFLAKVSDDIKVKYYVKAGLLEEAAKIAFEQRDIQSLLYVQSKYPSQSPLSEQINGFIAQLGTRKSTHSSIPIFS
ncbi:vacuolar protein sorting-associated protein 16 homolog [Onthophagus taurus]|uniref:vacuolar protein sorting-associated protein 16 homolog n=1 Tax=Onthophagus taurus TaxID=166361 RepID=UPI0039BE6A64